MTATAIDTVLVVDDEPQLRRLFAAFLDPDYEVRTAAGGAEALRECDEAVDAVLLDRRMPEVTGDEVLRRLRGRGFEGWIVMATAVDPDVDVVDMPFDEYLTKPVSREELLGALDALERRGVYDDHLGEYLRVVAKLGLLESRVPAGELAGSPEYTRLREECEQLKLQLDDAVAGASGDDLDAMFSAGD